MRAQAAAANVVQGAASVNSSMRVGAITTIRRASGPRQIALPIQTIAGEHERAALRDRDNGRPQRTRLDVVARLPAEEGLSQRRDVGNCSLGGIGLVLTDDAENLVPPVCTLKFDRGTEMDAPVARGGRLNLGTRAP